MSHTAPAHGSPPPRASVDFHQLQPVMENIQPRRHGFRASALAPAEGKGVTTTTAAYERAVAAYEREIEAIDDADDPLDVYCRYVRCVQDAHPAGQSSRSNLVNLLERATRALRDDERYRNDPRYLRLWLMYAENVEDARDIFAYLEAHGIGRRLAGFYEEHALLWESYGRHDKAEQQYRLGIEREAKPFDRLQRRYAEFQRRMAQRVADGVEETTGARRGLSGSTSVTSVDDSVSVSTGLASNTDGPSRERISIYRDDQSALPSENVAAHANARSTSAAWTELGTVKSRNKENSQKAEKWTGATLPQRPSAVTAKPVEKVPVFVEEQVQQRMKKSSSSSAPNPRALQRTESSATAPLTRDPLRNFGSNDEPNVQSSSHPVPSAPLPAKRAEVSAYARELLRGDDGQEQALSFEELRARVHFEKVQRSMQTVVSNNNVSAKSSSHNDDARRPPTPTMTISTKAALADIMGMFNQPLADDHDYDDVAGHQGQRGGHAHGDNTFDSDSDNDPLPDDMVEKTCTIIQQLPVQKLLFEKVEIFRDSAPPVSADRPSTGAIVGTATRRPLQAVVSTKSAVGQPTAVISPETRDSGPDPHAIYDESPLGRVSASTSAHKNAEIALPDIKKKGVALRKLSFGVQPSTADESGVASKMARDDTFVALVERNVSATVQPAFEPQFFTDGTDEQLADSADCAYAGPQMHCVGKPLDIMTPIAEMSAEFRSRSTISGLSSNRSKSSNKSNTTLSLLNTVEEEPTRDLLDNTFHNRFQIPDLGSIASPARFRMEGGDVDAVETLGSKLANEMTLTFDEDLTLSRTTRMTEVREKDVVVEHVQPEDVSPTVETTIDWLDADLVTKILEGVDLVSVDGYFEDNATDKNTRRAIDISLRQQRPCELGLMHGIRLFVEKHLGSGGFSDVYAASNMENDEEELALKIQSPASAWEFYVLKQLEYRLRDSPTLESVLKCYQIHVFRDESHLLLEYVREQSLLDHVNAAFQGDSAGGMDELLVMFFTTELLKTMRDVHRAGIIHGDIKADNVLVRLRVDARNATLRDDWLAQYDATGANGWHHKGVKLIDFGKSVDTMVFEDGIHFRCDWGKGKGDVLEQRQRGSWTFDLDYVGAAGVIHTMLFGKYLHAPTESASIDEWVRSWSWKRYWQAELWRELFSLLLGCNGDSVAEDGPRLDALVGRMQKHLTDNCERNGKSLKALLRRAEMQM